MLIVWRWTTVQLLWSRNILSNRSKTYTRKKKFEWNFLVSHPWIEIPGISRIKNDNRLTSEFTLSHKGKTLTPRRPIGKVTPTCPICHARQFQWRRCLRVSKVRPMFSQVLKTLLRLLNPKLISEIARNYSIFSEFWRKKNMFYGTSETKSVRFVHSRMTHRWRGHLFNTISYR